MPSLRRQRGASKTHAEAGFAVRRERLCTALARRLVVGSPSATAAADLSRLSGTVRNLAQAAARKTAPKSAGAKSEKPLSFLEIGVDLLGDLIHRQVADELLAVDEEGGCRVHPELVDGMVAHRLDGVETLLIREARIETVFGHAELFGDFLERRQRFFDHPIDLFGEQC